MDADLKALEDKITQLVVLSQTVRGDNLELRQALALAQDEVRQLKVQMQQASEKLESLIGQLPETI
jgi:outer membrane protein TolC